MRLGGFLLFAALASALTGCGKFMDKFSRINGDVTMVHFSSRGGGEFQIAGVLTGGLMLYFIDQGDTKKGRAFGFASEDELKNSSVLLPNGTYRVYAYGWDGGQKLAGYSRCALGDGGSDVVLSGAARTVTLTLDMASCQFGSDTEFSMANGADSTAGNFDLFNLTLCDGSAYSCSGATVGSWYLRAELLGGIKPSDGLFDENATYSIQSDCSSASSSGTINSNVRLPVGGSQFSPPLRIKVFSDSSCTTASATFSFLDGIKQYLNAASTSTYILDMPATNSYYTLRVPKTF